MFEWLRPEQRERRNKIRADRKHLEARARRFLKGYLNSEEVGKPQYYRAVEDISTANASQRWVSRNLRLTIAGSRKRPPKPR